MLVLTFFWCGLETTGMAQATAAGPGHPNSLAAWAALRSHRGSACSVETNILALFPDLWDFYLPYLYSGISLMGCLLLLRKCVSRPRGGLCSPDAPAPLSTGAASAQFSLQGGLGA